MKTSFFFHFSLSLLISPLVLAQTDGQLPATTVRSTAPPPEIAPVPRPIPHDTDPAPVLTDGGEDPAPEVAVPQGNPFSDSISAAAVRVSETPGGASLLTPSDWTGRAVSTEQLFEFEPGVYARERGVGTDVRISVRGSGIQRRFGDRGVTLLLDGVPINDADGSFYFRSIDPLSIAHIEVFRGANGLIEGGAQLGGAIAIVQKNGINAPGGLAVVELGRFDSYRSSIQYGGQEGALDYYFGYSLAETDGYRVRNRSRTAFYHGNLGYQWSDGARSRFFFHYSDSDAALPGSLALDEFLQDDKQAGTNRVDSADRDLATLRIGQRTEWATDIGDWEFYTNFQSLDFDHLINQGAFRFNRLIDYETREFQVGAMGRVNHQFLGKENTVRLRVAGNYGEQDERGFTGFVRPGRPVAHVEKLKTAANLQVYAENQLSLDDRQTIITGFGAVFAERESINLPGDQTRDPAYQNSQSGIVYRIAYQFEATEQTSLFANLSQSFEASPFSEASSLLDPQLARTWEVGVRHKGDAITAELAAYRSAIDGEFVDAEIAPGVSTTQNLDTVHQGVEVAVNTDLSNLFPIENLPFEVLLDQSYQFNDFQIEQGPDAGNQLPGVPDHVYSGRIRLRGNDEKWEAALTANWTPNGFVADNQNTLTTDGFLVWRLSGEISVTDKLTLFGGVDNLFDEAFVNSVSINPSGPAFLNPGNGRAIYGGVRLAW